MLSIVLVGLVILCVLGVSQITTLRKAHSTFANYYAFRGCVKLITKAPTYGMCKTASGQIITIVLYKDKWYLKGDLPIGLWGHLN